MLKSESLRTTVTGYFSRDYDVSIIWRTSYLTLSELLLKPSKQFIFFFFSKHQIIIGEISVLLFKLALQFVSRAFEWKLVHKRLDA